MNVRRTLLSLVAGLSLASPLAAQKQETHALTAFAPATVGWQRAERFGLNALVNTAIKSVYAAASGHLDARTIGTILATETAVQGVRLADDGLRVHGARTPLAYLVGQAGNSVQVNAMTGERWCHDVSTSYLGVRLTDDCGALHVSYAPQDAVLGSAYFLLSGGRFEPERTLEEGIPTFSFEHSQRFFLDPELSGGLSFGGAVAYKRPLVTRVDTVRRYFTLNPLQSDQERLRKEAIASYDRTLVALRREAVGIQAHEAVHQVQADFNRKYTEAVDAPWYLLIPLHVGKTKLPIPLLDMERAVAFYLLPHNDRPDEFLANVSSLNPEHLEGFYIAVTKGNALVNVIYAREEGKE